MGTSDAVEHSLASGVDMRASEVRVADDYTKRKHVLRVSSVNPCRSEFLLQADNTEEFTDWFKALQEQMATNTEAEAKFVSISHSFFYNRLDNTIIYLTVMSTRNRASKYLLCCVITKVHFRLLINVTFNFDQV